MPSTNTPELVTQKQEVVGFSQRAIEMSSTPFFSSKRTCGFMHRSLFVCWLSAHILGFVHLSKRSLIVIHFLLVKRIQICPRPACTRNCQKTLSQENFTGNGIWSIWIQTMALVRLTHLSFQTTQVVYILKVSLVHVHTIKSKRALETTTWLQSNVWQLYNLSVCNSSLWFSAVCSSPQSTPHCNCPR